MRRPDSVFRATLVAAALAASGAQAANEFTLPASFSVDYLGSAKLNVPIDVPPGTSGMVPHLSLSYSSSNGNGYVGVGWTLSGLPAITRCPHTIATNGAASPVTLSNGAGVTSYDVFCFQGEPLVQAQQQSAAGQQASQGQQFEPGQQLWAMSGSYYGAAGATYTTEIEGFSRIVSNGTAGSGPASIAVYTRSGLIYQFGAFASDNSRVVCTTNCTAGTVMTWMLDQVTDTVGNTITITYLQNNLRAYPSTIAYTTNSAQHLTTAQNVITFGYQTSGRSDAPLQYLAGQQIQTVWLLNTITTAVSGNTVSKYTLAYTSGLTGRSQLQSITRSGVTNSLLPLSFTYCNSCGGQPPDLITSFNNGLSGATTLTYLLTIHSAVYTPPGSLATYPSQNMTAPRYVVGRVTAPNGIGSLYTVNYTYFNGLQNLTGRGFLGFGYMCAWDSQTQMMKQSSYVQTFPNIGSAFNVMTVYTGASPNILVKNVATRYLNGGTYVAYNGRGWPYTTYVMGTTTTGSDLYGNPLPTISKTNIPDSTTASYGNIGQVTTKTTQDYGGVNTVYQDIGTYAYQNDTAGWNGNTVPNWIIGRLTSNQQVSSFTDNNNSANNSGSTTRLTTYSVDDITGFTTNETVDPSGGTGFTLSTTYTYDGYGHKITASAAGDSQTRLESWNYNAPGDPGHQFVYQHTNALTQNTYATFDPRWGLPITSTDVDGRVTTITYDDIGRKTTEVPPDLSTVSIGYHYCSGVHGGSLSCPYGAEYGIVTSQMGAQSPYQIAPTTTVFYDTLERDVGSIVQNFAENGYDNVTTTYNAQLQLASVSRPYATGATPQYTTYSYDSLNRVTQTNYPDNSWDTVTYVGTDQSITTGITSSYAGQNIWKAYDGQGNLVYTIQGVTESGTFTNIYTTFLYDGFNNLTKVTDTDGNITTYAYDNLGRKTGVVDPDAGTRVQSYTAFNELKAYFDLTLNITEMTYDALSRMVQRCWTNGQPSGDWVTCPHPSANEVSETWTYDTAANGVGELAQEATTQGSGYKAVHTYYGAGGTLGDLANSTITIGSQSFCYHYNYDGDNRLINYNAPSGAVPQTFRNQYGYVVALQDCVSTCFSVWSPTAQDAENHVLTVEYGNAIATTYTYSPTTGLMTDLLTKDPTNTHTLQSIAYSWDQLGNLKQRADAANSLTEAYAYDELNRLTTIALPNNGNAVENSFSYDVLGNMTYKQDVGTYAYPAAGQARPHGVIGITASGQPATSFVYDNGAANGNGLLTSEGGVMPRNVSWNVFSMVDTTTFANGTISLSYQYDPEHNRVMQTETNGGTKSITYYLPDGELTPPNGSGAGGPVWHTYFMAGGQRVAENWGATASATNYGPATTLNRHYFHTDYQNTISLVTQDGYVYGNASNPTQDSADVFGVPRFANGTADPTWGANDASKRRYINQEDVTDAQLIDLNARLYDPRLAKFFSPDPVINDQGDSQSWNAYAYAGNNPMSKSDPTGLFYVRGGWPNSDSAISGKSA